MFLVVPQRDWSTEAPSSCTQTVYSETTKILQIPAAYYAVRLYCIMRSLIDHFQIQSYHQGYQQTVLVLIMQIWFPQDDKPLHVRVKGTVDHKIKKYNNSDSFGVSQGVKCPCNVGVRVELCPMWQTNVCVYNMIPYCKYWMSASSQGFCSSCSPEQCWPPLLGAGLLQLRVLDLWPPEQEPQEDQQLQLPWITPDRE